MTSTVSELDTLRTAAEAGVRAMLRLVGEDPDRDGLLNTPHRVVSALMEMTNPGPLTPAELLSVQFDCEGENSEAVAVGPVAFSSVCEHHLLPFYGQAWIAYLPRDGKVVGLSKLPRLLDYYAHRLQVQERLTQQVTAAVVEHLAPDAACIVEAEHTCMAVRGARKPHTKMRSVSLTGAFRDDPRVRSELLATVSGLVRG